MAKGVQGAGRREPREIAEPRVTVTRHAVNRYLERGRLARSAWRLETELRGRVLEGISEGALLAATGDVHLLPLRTPRGPWLCLVLGVRGPAVKPHRVIVYTALTHTMAIETFGHVTGLIGQMSGVVLGRAVA
jgi:hypothetical protein